MTPVPNEVAADDTTTTPAVYTPTGWIALDQVDKTGTLAATNLVGTIDPGDYLFVGDLEVTQAAALGVTITPSLLWTDLAGAHDEPLATALGITAVGTTHFERFFRVASGTPQFKATATGVLTGLKWTGRAHLVKLA